MTSVASAQKRPCSTIPARAPRLAASAGDRRSGRTRSRRSGCPGRSGRPRLPSPRRSAGFAPRDMRNRSWDFQPKSATSTGRACFVPSRGESFDSSTTITTRRLACATIFSRKRAPPASLDQVGGRVDLVGAVDREVDRARDLFAQKRNPEAPRLLFGRPRGRDPGDVGQLSRPEPLAEAACREDRRRARAEAHDHSGDDQAGGAFSGRALERREPVGSGGGGHDARPPRAFR